MSAENLWQQLFDAVKTRFQRIYIVNGFQTDVGAHCFSWRDLNTSPIQDSEFPCIMVRDVKRETLREGRVINAHDHELTIEVYAGAKASGSTDIEAPWIARPRMMMLRSEESALISEPTVAISSMITSMRRRP